MDNKRTVLITGCSDGGLGAALAIAFHKTGKWRVFASARNSSKMNILPAAGIELITLDITNKTSISNAVTEISKLTDGTLDALVNNAGAVITMPVADLDMDELRSHFELNVFAPVAVTQAFLPLLLKSHYGAMIVNHTSSASVLSFPFQGAYCAGKAAASTLSATLRIELEPFGIKVVDLRTGSVKSNIFANAQVTEESAKLPEGSIYNAARESIEGTMSGKWVKDLTSADEWAALVVSDVSQKEPPKFIWRGKSAGIVKMLTGWAPLWVVEYMLKDLASMSVVGKKIKEQKKEI